MEKEIHTLLLVEDDEGIGKYLLDNLTQDGFSVFLTDCVKDGLRLIESKYPDLVLVDVGLPDKSGLELVEQVRSADGVNTKIDPNLPILVLSGRSTELDRLRGFERGCDDYLTKPFSYPELLARVKSLLRRSQQRSDRGVLKVGDLTVDPTSRYVTVGEHKVELSQKEFALVRQLATEPTRVFSKQELLRNVWGYRSIGSTRTLDSHACRVRKKLGVDQGRYIVNVWGVGYRLIDAIDDATARGE